MLKAARICLLAAMACWLLSAALLLALHFATPQDHWAEAVDRLRDVVIVGLFLWVLDLGEKVEHYYRINRELIRCNERLIDRFRQEDLYGEEEVS
jgi:hypothetical protein